MIDYCLKNLDEPEFNQLMLDTGLCVEVTEGEETTIVPASYEVLIDRIGPITIGETTYPEYYSNLRLLNGLPRIRRRHWPFTPSTQANLSIGRGCDRQSA